jgi:hypothetical protein
MLVLTLDKYNRVFITDSKTKEVIGSIKIADKASNKNSCVPICFDIDKKYCIVRSDVGIMNERT